MTIQEQIDRLRRLAIQLGLENTEPANDFLLRLAADTLEKLNARNIKLEALYKAAYHAMIVSEDCWDDGSIDDLIAAVENAIAVEE